ncbi:MAG: outer membrane lipoprotein-sorting protein [Spirochaeta sp.]|jgi:outer membrane lipoprotein-sorting protein|nr:outer membrane lipoprotein-sorting protein [Spirochaeta sp.]
MRSMQLRRLALVCGVAVAVGLGIVPGTRLARVAAQESGSGDSLSAEEVVRRLEENRVYETSRAEMSMTISDRFGERESTMIAWSRGDDETLIEFTSAAERGQKILRTADEIYLYYPDAAELVRLQGAALRESMLGSDVSYEDLTGGKTLLDTYNVTLSGREQVDGHDTYRIELEARRRNVAYPRQTMWVDAQLFVARKSEQYALSGRLLKTVHAGDIEEIDGYPVPMRMEISDALKRNSSTTVVIEELEIGLPIDEYRFSLEELSW